MGFLILIIYFIYFRFTRSMFYFKLYKGWVLVYYTNVLPVYGFWWYVCLCV